MTGTKLQELLDAHCLEMKANMPGFLFYGILSCKDGTILSKASANEESSRIVTAFAFRFLKVSLYTLVHIGLQHVSLF